MTPPRRYDANRDPAMVQLRALGILSDDQLLRIAEERAAGRLDLRRRTARAPHERRALDAYYTPEACALACLRRVAEDLRLRDAAFRRIVEPHAGDGAWVRAARQVWPSARVAAYDVDPAARGLELADERQVGDWLTLSDRERGNEPLIVGNPPYSNAREHVEAALLTGGTCAFLLRVGFLASRGRKQFWAEHPPARVYALIERPGFLGANGKTDSQEYALFVWTPQPLIAPRLGWISWQKSAPGSTSAPAHEDAGPTQEELERNGQLRMVP